MSDGALPFDLGRRIPNGVPPPPHKEMCWRWRSNPSENTRPNGTVISTIRKAAHASGCARCGAGAGFSAIQYQYLSQVYSVPGVPGGALPFNLGRAPISVPPTFPPVTRGSQVPKHSGNRRKCVAPRGGNNRNGHITASDRQPEARSRSGTPTKPYIEL